MKCAPSGVVVVSAAFVVSCFAAGPTANLMPGVRNATFAIQEKSKDQNQVKSFTGSIAKTSDRFVLIEDASHTLFDLDDQNSAGKFSGRKVKVTGTLDAVNNMIHIQTIEQVSA